MTSKNRGAKGRTEGIEDRTKKRQARIGNNKDRSKDKEGQGTKNNKDLRK